jgi:hypothetical protein
MYQPPKNFLYSPYKIEISFSCKSEPLQGTAFVIAIDDENLAIITNRHLVDLLYTNKNQKYIGQDCTIKSIILMGRRDDDSIYKFEIDKSAIISFSNNNAEDVAVFISPLCKPI